MHPSGSNWSNGWLQSVGRRGVSLPVHMAIQFEVASRFPTNVLKRIPLQS